MNSQLMTSRSCRAWLLAGLLGVPLGGAAEPLTFDPDGAGSAPPIPVASFDWSVSGMIAVGGNAAVTACVQGACGEPFDILTHSRLVGTLNGSNQANPPSGLGTAFEITTVVGFTATVQSVIDISGQQIAVVAVDPARRSFVRWYYDRNLNSDFPSGTGFDDGRLILEGVLAEACTGNILTSQGEAQVLLDQSSNGNQWGIQLTVRATGTFCQALTFDATRLVLDPEFFLSGVASLQYANVSTALPFISIDPSRQFLGVVPSLGEVNALNGSGPDVLYQTDYNSPVAGACAGRIGDFVWHDVNRNGRQDPGEPGINGVTVTLQDTAGTTLATTTTGVNPATGQGGYYQFTGLCAGSYQVVAPLALADGKTLTVANAPGVPPDQDSNPVPAPVTLPTSNSSDQTIDFGYISPCTGSIGDFVWYDVNRNGIQDGGEPGIDGVTVTLRNAAGDVIATTTTGVNPVTGEGGYYQFSGLCAGGYQVEVPPLLGDGKTLTIANAPGSNPTNDSNPNPALVTLPGDNSSDQTIDFGYVAPPCTGAIGDFVWHDLNRNGIQDAGEPGIDGVTVTLRDAAGAVIATTTTGPNGYYQFSGLCAGAYSVGVPQALADGKVLTVANAPGSTPANDSNPNPAIVVLPTDDSSDQTIDFGYVVVCTGSIGDFVWHDLNRNGIQDANEPGINGVTVMLKRASDNAVIATTTTAANPATGEAGYYQFGGLCAGDYRVEVPPVLGDGKVLTTANVGGDRTIDSNPNPAPVTLPTDNSSNQTIDFGYVAACTGSIGDFVWHDLNRNGIQDANEPGIGGVPVTLKDASGNVIATTTTGPNPGGDRGGYYQFTGLCAGSYVVEVPTVLADGKTPTIANAPGSTPANDSNPIPASVTLPTDNSSDQTIDFGYVAPCTGSIGDFVWFDMNANGIQDANEPGIAGVPVTLRRASDNSVIATTTTGPNGYYQFTGLCAGDYLVEVPPRLGDGKVLTIANAPGSTAANDSNPNPAPVTLPTDNSSDQTIDFGYYMVLNPGTGTPGYWMNHPNAWPVSSITIGGYAYIKAQAIALMKKPVAGDKRYTMFPALVAAKLNVLVGNDPTCIAGTIAAADAWMAQYPKLPAGSAVPASSPAWKVGEPLYLKLDAYNNGLLCAPSRDS